MKKLRTRFLALCMALVLIAPLLVQPAEASSTSYDGTPLFWILFMDSDGDTLGPMSGFLAYDPETDSTYLLSSHIIYDLAQEGYSAYLIGEDEFYSEIVPLGKSGGISYLYVPGLENAPSLALNDGSRKNPTAVYYDENGQLTREGYNLNSGWKKDSSGLLTYTGHEVESLQILGAPMVSADDSSVIGCINMSDETVMMLAPIERGTLSAEYSIEALSGGTSSGSSGSGSSSGSSGSDSGSSGGSSSDRGSDEADTDEGASGGIPGWVWIVAGVAVVFFLFYRSSSKKNASGQKAAPVQGGTVPLASESFPTAANQPEKTEDLMAPSPTLEQWEQGNQANGTRPGPTQEAYGPTVPVPRWVLRGVSGPLKGRSFPLSQPLRIGRSSQCDIVFPEGTPGVSSSHCLVTPEGDQIYLEEIRATYGTYLSSGVRLGPGRTLLHAGDVFCLSQNGPSFRLEAAGPDGAGQGGVQNRAAIRDMAGRVYRAGADGCITLGRSGDNQVRLSDDGVSSHHCKLFLQEGKLHLTDLGSTNGTFFNDRERLKSNTPYRIRKGMAFFLSSPKNTFVVIEE